MHLYLDITFMYLACGSALVAFLHYSDLFFFTSTSYDDGSPINPGNAAIRSLMFCINAGIFATSILVWPIVLAACLNLEGVDEEPNE